MARRPKPTVADLTFLREMIETAREVVALRKAANRHVNELRFKLVSRIVNALYTRYRRYMRNEENPPSFALWLKDKKQMEYTYLFHSFPTRQRWASRPIRLTLEAAFAMEGEEFAGDWYYRLFEELINQKDPQGLFYISIVPGETNSEDYPNNPTVDFDATLKSERDASLEEAA